jgi:hypothetical protein
MADVAGCDWSGYFHSLRDEEARALASWLADEDLGVGEFMEVVDRAYATASDDWHGRLQPFLAQVGRPAAEGYARCKRRATRLLTMLEQALMSGALPGEVAPQELALPVLARVPQRQVEDVLGALERLRHGQE